MKIHSREVVLPHALAHHLEWARATENHLPASHLAQGGTVNDINTILLDRAIDGLDHYGTYLMTHNERDSVRDLIDELADAYMYATQCQLNATDDRDAARMRKIQGQLCEMLHIIVPSWREKSESELGGDEVD